ncbi:MAG: hypothetical protein ACLUNZ_06200 [Evtepia sp.]
MENVSDFLSEGQTVKVKVVNIDEAGRINLSIKKATPLLPVPRASAGTGRTAPPTSGAVTAAAPPPGWPQLQQRRRAVLRQPFRRPQLPPRRPLRCPPVRRPRRLRGSPEAVHAGLRQPSCLTSSSTTAAPPAAVATAELLQVKPQDFPRPRLRPGVFFCLEIQGLGP